MQMKQSFKTILQVGLFAAAAVVSAGVFAARYPAPSTVSPEMAAMVNAPAQFFWAKQFDTAAQVSALAKDYAKNAGVNARAFARALNVTVEEEKLAGVPVYRLTPQSVPAVKAGKVILYLHGGGYIIGHGVSGIMEAVPLAGWHGYKVVSPDYQMAPEHPYPAAIDDAFAVYKELIKTVAPENIAVYGSSTGGAMTLILGEQIARAGLPMPSALIAGTPWTDLGPVGDSYVVNDGLDNVLGSYNALLKTAVKLYAGGHDLRDPLLSPVYAADSDLKKFPPVLLISGTRDLFLSNTVRMQRRFLLLDKPVDLIVYEAMSHVQYYVNPKAPETAEHYRFLDDWLAKVWKSK